MRFFCYHRDRPGSAALRDELLEEHWSYMDRYAAGMIARGPTFGRGGETATGGVHIVDLPDVAAARAFAFDEPNYQAGVYRDVLLRRWQRAGPHHVGFPRRQRRRRPVSGAGPRLR
ncbi:YciI family protein [Spongiactinospora gelatinilytica]|uniref:YciI family protein n=1 Tax=Spongiactinospora gelatinilytica TaxID=2666298 RepID=UPI001F454ED3|nr:YciI family protein [Spongiactinospora gelatinilytica]